MSNFGSLGQHHADVCKIKERLVLKLKGFLKSLDAFLQSRTKSLAHKFVQN